MLTCSSDLSRPVQHWAPGLHNDFEETVFAAHPRLQELSDELCRLGASGTVMSGSGSTIVGVFASVQNAHEAGDLLAGENTVIATPLDPNTDGAGGCADGA